MTSTGWRKTDIIVGSLACSAIAMHDYAHISAGRYYDVFWICNVAALALGLGILFKNASLVFVGFAWLLPGTAVWLVDAVVAGSNILPTSYAVHLGGSAAATYGVMRCGHAKHGVVAALAALVFAVVVSRVVLPEAANVNAAHAVPGGWGFLGGSRLAFVSVSLALVIATLGAAELGARAIARRIQLGVGTSVP